ncbi:MAG: AAA family ATPase [Beijerinckiaceae bacterium]|nr:AAA family ATPase [Beijerinckiaceae bacterium]MCZ8299311.1 AAA family ATPase [Beijerinckiaceae bacterium]
MADITVAPLPHIAIQVFSETGQVAAVVEEARHDRRMAKAQVRIQSGGVAAAAEAYRDAPTPNVIVIETVTDSNTLLDSLDELAGYCDEGTRVVVVGHVNDVPLYRELMRRGVSEYLVAPINVLGFVTALSEIFTTPGAKPIGRTIAVVGAKGGIGASTIAHNLAYTIATDLEVESVIVDLDLPFGTAGLDFNQDPPQGVMEAAFDPSRVDPNMIERLLSRVVPNLSLMAAPSNLERIYDFGPDTFDPLADALRQTVPAIVFDVPHVWTGWSRTVLARADEIVVVAAPDLANLRNAKNLIDTLTLARPQDPKPKLVLNQVGIPKKPEIAAAEFAKALDCPPVATIGFDTALFGLANNNGQMIAELQPKSKARDAFLDMAKALMGRQEAVRNKKSLLSSLRERLNGLSGKTKAA